MFIPVTPVGEAGVHKDLRPWMRPPTRHGKRMGPKRLVAGLLGLPAQHLLEERSLAEACIPPSLENT